MSCVLMGAFKPDYPYAGFLQPIFRDNDPSKYYFQQVSYSGDIEKFTPARSIAEPTEENFYLLPAGASYQTGGPAAYFFLAADGQVLAGRLEDILRDLLLVLESPQYDAYGKLEVATALRMYGYINETIMNYKINGQDGGEHSGIDQYTVREDFILLQERNSTRSVDVDGFFFYAQSLAEQCNRRLEDFIVFNEKSAYCDQLSTPLGEIPFLKFPRLMERIFLYNLPYIDGRVAVHLLSSVQGLYFIFEQALSIGSFGLFILERLPQELVHFIGSKHLLDPQKIESALAKREKGADSDYIPVLEEIGEIKRVAAVVKARRAQLAAGVS